MFSALADRMHEHPAMRVRLFLDVQRRLSETAMASEVLREFAARFVGTQWPRGRPLPTVYYFPASLAEDPAQRASLHAKCVVIDDSIAFVSSANFTEAAQTKNIEVGLLLRSEPIARRLTHHFDALIDEGIITELDLGRVSP